MTSSAADLSSPTPTDGPWYKRVHGLHVLKLKGGFYEMGHQHGELLRDHIPDGPLPYYRTYIERIMGPSPLSKLLWPVLNRTIGARVARAIPDFVTDTLRGLAHGSGIPERDILAGATMPDSLMWLAARLLGFRSVGPALHHRLAMGLGCTSAVAWGDATADGRLLHARNLDYHGVNSWPKTAAVIFHEPDDGQRYVSVAAAGVPLGGITAMNASGLTLTVHQHMFTDATRLGGTPIGFVGDLVMRHADSLEEAERILRAHTPIGCWTYLVTDGNRREVLCWEENPDRQVAHRVPQGEGTFSYTNIYIDPELGGTELDVYGSYWRHNQGRWARAKARLAEGRGSLDPTAMAGILADLGSRKRPGQQLVGFAAETDDLIANAERKLASKNADFIVANDVSAPATGFGHDTNAVTILSPDGGRDSLALASKFEIARAVLRRVAAERMPSAPPGGS